MLGTTFRHDLLRKYTVLFGNLFNDIHITRKDDSGTVQTLKVPLIHGAKDKLLARIKEDPDLNPKFAIQLPIISFRMDNMVYDTSRHLIRNQRYMDAEGNNVLTPVPYNILWSVSILVKNVSDGTQIIEQILPHFTPNFNTHAIIIDEPEIKLTIPVTLLSVSNFDDYEGPFEQRRTIMWDLQFEQKALLFGPTEIIGDGANNIIKLVNTSFYAISGNVAVAAANSSVVWDERTHVQPGLTANGEPTTNVDASISYLDINIGDDWDYIKLIKANDQNE